jgi:hypothetical protein
MHQIDVGALQAIVGLTGMKFAQAQYDVVYILEIFLNVRHV